jgi:hypothetical protein
VWRGPGCLVLVFGGAPGPPPPEFFELPPPPPPAPPGGAPALVVVTEVVLLLPPDPHADTPTVTAMAAAVMPIVMGSRVRRMVGGLSPPGY